MTTEANEEALAELGCILIPAMLVALLGATYFVSQWLFSKGWLMPVLRYGVGIYLIVLIIRVARSRKEAD